MSSPESYWLPILLSRQLRDGERLHVGAGQETAQLAAALANSSSAKSLSISIAGATVLRDVGIGPYVGKLASDFEVLASADLIFEQERYFDAVGKLPTVMASGFQIDRRGNLNLVGIRDTRWIVKGPGMVGLPSLTGFAKRLVLYVERHDRRRLVDEVEFTTVLGDPKRRAELGLSPATIDGRVVTPEAVFSWDDSGITLDCAIPGVGLSDLQDRTGFPLRPSASYAEAEPVTPHEASFLQAQTVKVRSRDDPPGSSNSLTPRKER